MQKRKLWNKLKETNRKEVVQNLQKIINFCYIILNARFGVNGELHKFTYKRMGDGIEFKSKELL